MKKDGKDNIKKIKNILSDEKKDINEFDVLFLVDATGSMAPYIIAAKEETNNIAEELRQTYPEMNFQYGYIFYRDPIDSKEDIHEMIDLTDNVNSLPEKIGKIEAKGGGDLPEDWVGAYKLVNEKISWRNGTKVIIHLTDAGAHGKLFTKSDKYPEEEQKLIQELEKCALKNIKIFGYIIKEDCRNSFDECSKIYRSKGGSFEIFNFLSPNLMNNNLMMNPMMMKPTMMHDEPKMGMNPMMGGINPMMNMPSNPMMDMGKNPMMGMGMNPMMGMGGMDNMGMNPMMNMYSNPDMTMKISSSSRMDMSCPIMMNNEHQNMLNMNFRMNAINSISNSMGGIKKD